MDKIQTLLSQISLLSKKNNEILEIMGTRFNIFHILGVSHYENTHSTILAELLNPEGTHGLHNSFLKLFLDINQIEGFDSRNALVRTEVAVSEYGRIDILIESSNWAVIIENKFYAKDQPEQLKRYNEYAIGKYGVGNYMILYLTPDGRYASDDSGRGVDYRCISYKKTIIEWLGQCVGIAVHRPLVRETINQYINYLKQLTGQDMSTIVQSEIINLLSDIVFGCGGIFSIIVMIYTYCNIEEVLSCRFIWGNSNVSIFSFSLIYTLRKGILAFLLPGAIYFSIFLFLMEDNKNNETEQVTEQVKANAKPSASEKKDAKDKEVVMVCEYIEKGDYYIYYPEQCMAQNDNNLVFLSENGIKIEAFFQ